MKSLLLFICINWMVFSVAGQGADTANACTDLQKEVDDFTGEVTLSTPGYVSTNVSIEKHIKNGKASYYLSLDANGETYVSDGKGVIVLFTDGSRWTKPTKIDVHLNEGKYTYWAYSPITLSDLTVFSTKKIKKYRLYIFDQEVDEKVGDEFACFVKGIKAAK